MGSKNQDEPLDRAPLGPFPSEQRWRTLRVPLEPIPLALIPLELIRAGTCCSAHTGPAQRLPHLLAEVLRCPGHRAGLARTPGMFWPHCRHSRLFRPGLGRELSAVFPPDLVAGTKKAPVLLGHRAREMFPARSKGGFGAALSRTSRSICEWS